MILMLVALFPLSRFADHTVVRKINSILKDMFYGPWATWKDVDRDSRNAMWERFNVCTYYCL